MSASLNSELIYIQQMVQPLLLALQKLSVQLQAATQAGSLVEIKALLSSIRLNLRVFYSLNSPGLTEASSICQELLSACMKAVNLSGNLPSD